MEKILSELDAAVGKVGLELHCGKITAMDNAIARQADGRQHLQIGSTRVAVLEEGLATKYLGRALRLD